MARQKANPLRSPLLAAACLSLLATAGCPAGHANPLSQDEMILYLVQTLCVDATGQPVSRLPVDPACQYRRPQTLADTAVYRKHDWPDRTDPRHPVTGYQASDSVIASFDPYPVIIQTFDFGDTSRVFGRFDAGQGDGGQALLLVDGSATIAMTEDGGDGVQWFISDDCRTTTNPERHFLGWLLFDSEITGQWSGGVTHLNKGRSPTDCPARFNAAYTRYRSATIRFPFRTVDAEAAVKTSNYPLEVIISEHYGGQSIAAADHLERFYLAKNLGLIRWERWTHSLRASNDSARLAQSGRCPPLDPEEPLDADWKRVDCRTWTTFVAQQQPWSVAQYHWAAPDPLAQLAPRQSKPDQQ